MMNSRDAIREVRLLLAIQLIAAEGRDATVPELVSIDFLIQHPSIVGAFAESSVEVWPDDLIPDPSETESSEEALLLWKRASGQNIVIPSIRSLLSRGLVVRNGLDGIALSPLGQQAANRFKVLDLGSVRRLRRVAHDFARSPDEAQFRFQQALSGKELP